MIFKGQKETAGKGTAEKSGAHCYISNKQAPDPNSTKIHHRIIVRARTKKVHR